MKNLRTIIALTFVMMVGFNMNAQDKNENKPFKPTYKVNGRIQYDLEFLKRENAAGGLNENEYRRIHFSVKGNVAKKVAYKVEVDFAHASLGFRDMYIKYNAGKYGNIIAGSYAEPTSLNMATSSKYITFNERSMLTALQNFRWGSGMHYENYGLFGGKATLQFAFTNNGLNGDGFADTAINKGLNFASRFTTTVMNDKEKNQVIHLGVNYDNRPYKDLKFRAENHMGTNEDSGKYHYVFTGADGRSDLGFELGSTFGSLSLQGEYKTQNINAANKDYTMSSYYTFVSYFLTGEHRPYKHGSFGRVKPKSDIDNGGFGAIELAVRYSNMNASKDVLLANPTLPENVNNLTFGFNWYLNSRLRFMYNYVTSDDSIAADSKLNQHLLRIQMDF